MLAPIKTNITVMVSDMDSAITFYINLLGLTLTQRYGNHYAEIESPGVNIGLHPTTNPITPGKNISIGLGVENLDLSLEVLRNANVECNVVKDGPRTLVHFSDPDGNPLYLIAVDQENN